MFQYCTLSENRVSIKWVLLEVCWWKSRSHSTGVERALSSQTYYNGPFQQPGGNRTTSGESAREHVKMADEMTSANNGSIFTLESEGQLHWLDDQEWLWEHTLIWTETLNCKSREHGGGNLKVKAPGQIPSFNPCKPISASLSWLLALEVGSGSAFLQPSLVHLSQKGHSCGILSFITRDSYPAWCLQCMNFSWFTRVCAYMYNDGDFRKHS